MRLAELAGDISALTHASADTVEACVLWTDAIRQGHRRPGAADGHDRLGRLVSGGLDLVPRSVDPCWSERSNACRTTPPEEFTPNGYVVSALQAALSSLAQTQCRASNPVVTSGWPSNGR